MNKIDGTTRWVLGFDGDCSTCSYLAQQLMSLSEGKLTAQSLRASEVREWREHTLGEEAPWMATLFAVDGMSVRAWTGAALAIKLGRLLGPNKLWQAVGIIGELMDRPLGPVSPRRRLILRQGVAGIAATAAFLGAEAGQIRIPALSQTAFAEGEVEIEAKRRWEIRLLSGNAHDRMRDRAKDDRNFDKIRDHFAHNNEWQGKGRDSVRASFKGNRVRDVLVQRFEAPDLSEIAYAVYGEEDGGKKWSRGFVIRTGRIAEVYYVKNGKLRNDDGRVSEETDDVATEAISSPFPINYPAGSQITITECDIDAGLCGLLGLVGCGGAAYSVVVICGPTAVACLAPNEGGLAYICGTHGGEFESACRTWASEGKC